MATTAKVGDPATICYFNDMYPATVIKITPATITVRKENRDCTSNPNGKTEVFTKRGDGRFVKKGRSSPRLSIGEREFYQNPEI